MLPAFKKSFVLILLVTAMLASMAQVNYFSLPPGRKSLTVPFGNFDNLVIVDMMLNDSLPVRLMLDSGVEGVIITDGALISEMERHCIRKFKLLAPGTLDELEACITRPAKLSVNRLMPVFTNLILLQEDYFALDEYIGTKVHGLIGMEKFRNLVVTTNYDRNLLVFSLPENYSPPARSVIIPLSLNRGKPYMTARVALDDGSINEMWLMIDSGANHPLLLEIDSLSDYRPKKSIDAIIGKGLGGNLHGSFARVNWLMLGNYRLDDVITSFTDSYLPGSVSSRVQRNGTLGSGSLGRFRVTFDYTNQRMILQKGNKFRQPFEYNMSGLAFRAIGSGFYLFEVSEVIPGSPAAEAGVKSGDVLVSINGKATFGMKLGDINQLLSQKQGSGINMMVLREGKRMDFRFKLRKLI